MPQLEPGAVFAGHRIEAVAGRGGMGVVYRATQLDLERPVALKLISPAYAEDEAFRERFKRESQLAAAIDHPNILPVYQAGEVEEQLFITMRYVPGTDLSRLIADEGRLELGRAVRIIGQVAAALDAAHARGLVHRDVKPANILLTGDEQEHVYLTDFGLTKHAGSTSGVTKTGQFVGTLDYVSPEQIEGGQADARSDVYALGGVLFHAWTGSRPYERDTDMAKLFAHVNDPVPAITALIGDAPQAADDVIRRSLAKLPEDRYPSAGDLARAARAAVEGPGEQVAERSVATGAAAPGSTAPMAPPADALTAATRAVHPAEEVTERLAPAATPAPAPHPVAAPAGTPAPGRPVRRDGARRPLALAAGGAIALILAIVVLASLLGGGDGGGEKEQAASGGPRLGSAPVATAGWKALPAAPTARQFAATAVAGGEIWVMGGLTKGGATRTVEVYDPATSRWRAGPDLPLALHHAMAIPYEDEPVVLGGFVPQGSNPTGKTSDKVFALRGGAWSALPSLPRARARGGVSVVGDRIVVVGGRGPDGSLLRATDVFDGSSWGDGAPLPTPREDLAVATESEFVYATGGSASGRSSGAFERYDPTTNSWQQLSDLPTPRSGLGIAVARDQVVAAGGEAGGRTLATVQAFDLVGEQWAKLPALPAPRYGPGVESYEKAVYVVTGSSGRTSATSTRTASVLRFAAGRKPGR